MSEKNLSKNNNIIFFTILLFIITYVLFYDKIFQYEDDKSFFSEFIRSTKYHNSDKMIPEPEARAIMKVKADLVIKAIKFKNFTLLKQMIHPKHGVRFSPYLYVMSTDIVFSGENIKSRYDNDYVYDWGANRSHRNLRMSFSEYYRRYIYNYDYAISNDITYNQLSETGNVVDNIYSFYPNSIIVEYYADRQVEVKEAFLRLVFEEYKDDWFLSGIITISN
ncbi:MAG: hypothetical protein HON23_06700 [Rickettsiales bacterium]|jgi:hypothetical protein|nr:hypothetical protein [Rickettsiales bacterium]